MMTSPTWGFPPSVFYLLIATQTHSPAPPSLSSAFSKTPKKRQKKLSNLFNFILQKEPFIKYVTFLRGVGGVQRKWHMVTGWGVGWWVGEFDIKWRNWSTSYEYLGESDWGSPKGYNILFFSQFTYDLNIMHWPCDLASFKTYQQNWIQYQTSSI